MLVDTSWYLFVYVSNPDGSTSNFTKIPPFLEYLVFYSIRRESTPDLYLPLLVRNLDLTVLKEGNCYPSDTGEKSVLWGKSVY